MASPQKENGFTPIANELLEAMMKHDFGFSKGQIFTAIIRLTYGWHKKSDKISISRICNLTKLCKRTVIYTLQNLEAQHKIIIKRTIKNHEKQINEIAIQKDYEQWDDNSFAPPYAKLKLKAKDRSAKLRSSAKLIQKVVQNSVKKVNSFAHTKETIKETTKDTLLLRNKGQVQYGDPDINKVIKYFEDSFNIKLNKVQFNRRVAYRLIKKGGLPAVKQIIDLAKKCFDEPYAPRIYNFMDLEEKMPKLKNFYKSKALKGVFKV